MKSWAKVGLIVIGVAVAGFVGYGLLDDRSRKAESEAFDLAYANLKEISLSSKDLPWGVDPLLAMRPEYEEVVAKCTVWAQGFANNFFDPGRDKARLALKDWEPVGSRPMGNGGDILLLMFETVDQSVGVVACSVSEDNKVNTSRILMSKVTPR